jgi:hypothetical protein
MFTEAYIAPKFLQNVRIFELNAGSMEMLKPPYPEGKKIWIRRQASEESRSTGRQGGYPPYWYTGAVPLKGVSLCLTMNIGTFVPSLLGYHTCFTRERGGINEYVPYLLTPSHHQRHTMTYLLRLELIRI